MSSPKVTYSYANGSANTIRPTSVTYPDNTGGTRVLTYDYGTSGGMNDKLSRVENLGFGGTSNLVQPSYLGLGTQVRTDYTQPQVRWDLATGSSPNPYAGLDRFGRVIDNKWSNSSTSATLDQIKYTYDRASNRTTRENTVAKAQTTPQYFDELYGYDGSNRLTQMQRGQLAGTTSITNLQFAQDWDLDPTGNWQQFNEDSDGSGTNDLVQARTANPVNEITDITNSMGAPWVQPGYDAAGNMTTIPRGNEPEAGFTGVYDAWNRLVKLLDEDDSVVAEYAYDGLTRRIRKTTAAETRHYLYNASWQILEERVGSATTYDQQYVWGLRYIDDCVLRDRKLTSSVERLYALQDANWNVDALVDTSGSVVERFSYAAYGVPSFLNPDFTAKSASSYSWDVLYAGYKWDAESGMYQVRYRYLLPRLGGWVTRDPIVYGDMINLYGYTYQSPVNHLDFIGEAGDDIKLIKRVVREYGLSKEGRSALHKALQYVKGPGGLAGEAVVRAEAAEIQSLGGKFIKGGGAALGLIGAILALENTAQAAEVPIDWRQVRHPKDLKCICKCARYVRSLMVPSWWVLTSGTIWGEERLGSKKLILGNISAEDCRSFEDNYTIEKEESVLGYTIYNVSRVKCTFSGVAYGHVDITQCCNKNIAEDTADNVTRAVIRGF